MKRRSSGNSRKTGKRALLAVLSAVLLFGAAGTAGVMLSGCSDTASSQDSDPAEMSEQPYSANQVSSFVLYGDDIYYWEHNENSFESIAVFGNYSYRSGAVSNLVRLHEEGEKETVYTGSGFGELAIVDDRIYLNSLEGLYSIDRNGQDRRAYTTSAFCNWLAFDEESGSLIYCENDSLLRLDTQTQESGLLAADAEFLAYKDGIVYYVDRAEEFASSGRAHINAVNADGSNPKSLTVTPELYEKDLLDQMSEILVPCLQFDGDLIYIAYGSVSGNGRFYQGCAIARFPADGGDCEVLIGSAERYVGEIFYLVHTQEEGEKLYFHDNTYQDGQLVVRCLDLADRTESIASIPLGRVQEPFYNGDDVCVYPDASGILTTLIRREDYSNLSSESAPGAMNETYLSVTDMEQIGEHVYFAVEYSTHSPDNDIGWRYAYQREISNVYCKNLTTGATQLLHSR